MTTDSILRIENLTVIYESQDRGTVYADRALSLNIPRGKIIGIIGGSGSGKTSAMLATMGLLPKEGKVADGLIHFESVDMTPSHYESFLDYEKAMSKIRGKDISMIFQNAMEFFNPIENIGKQIREVVQNHQRISRWKANALIEQMLADLNVPEPHRTMKKYPMELSGGILQRCQIAIALMNKPKLLIADEPFSALDAENQAIVSQRFRELNQFGSSVILVLHDLVSARELCDEIVVMKDGTIIESGSCKEVFEHPQDPYTKELLEMGLDQ